MEPGLKKQILGLLSTIRKKIADLNRALVLRDEEKKDEKRTLIIQQLVQEHEQFEKDKKLDDCKKDLRRCQTSLENCETDKTNLSRELQSLQNRQKWLEEFEQRVLSSLRTATSQVGSEHATILQNSGQKIVELAKHVVHELMTAKQEFSASVVSLEYKEMERLFVKQEKKLTMQITQAQHEITERLGNKTDTEFLVNVEETLAGLLKTQTQEQTAFMEEAIQKMRQEEERIQRANFISENLLREIREISDSFRQEQARALVLFSDKTREAIQDFEKQKETVKELFSEFHQASMETQTATAKDLETQVTALIQQAQQTMASKNTLTEFWLTKEIEDLKHALQIRTSPEVIDQHTFSTLFDHARARINSFTTEIRGLEEEKRMLEAQKTNLVEEIRLWTETSQALPHAQQSSSSATETIVQELASQIPQVQTLVHHLEQEKGTQEYVRKEQMEIQDTLKEFMNNLLMHQNEIWETYVTIQESHGREIKDLKETHKGELESLRKTIEKDLQTVVPDKIERARILADAYVSTEASRVNATGSLQTHLLDIIHEDVRTLQSSFRMWENLNAQKLKQYIGCQDEEFAASLRQMTELLQTQMQTLQSSLEDIRQQQQQQTIPSYAQLEDKIRYSIVNVLLEAAEHSPPPPLESKEEEGRLVGKIAQQVTARISSRWNPSVNKLTSLLKAGVTVTRDIRNLVQQANASLQDLVDSTSNEETNQLLQQLVVEIQQLGQVTREEAQNRNDIQQQLAALQAEIVQQTDKQTRSILEETKTQTESMLRPMLVQFEAYKENIIEKTHLENQQLATSLSALQEEMREIAKASSVQHGKQTREVGEQFFKIFQVATEHSEALLMSLSTDMKNWAEQRTRDNMTFADTLAQLSTQLGRVEANFLPEVTIRKILREEGAAITDRTSSILKQELGKYMASLQANADAETKKILDNTILQASSIQNRLEFLSNEIESTDSREALRQLQQNTSFLKEDTSRLLQDVSRLQDKQEEWNRLFMGKLETLFDMYAQKTRVEQQQYVETMRSQIVEETRAALQQEMAVWQTNMSNLNSKQENQTNRIMQTMHTQFRDLKESLSRIINQKPKSGKRDSTIRQYEQQTANLLERMDTDIRSYALEQERLQSQIQQQTLMLKDAIEIDREDHQTVLREMRLAKQQNTEEMRKLAASLSDLPDTIQKKIANIVIGNERDVLRKEFVQWEEKIASADSRYRVQSEQVLMQIQNQIDRFLSMSQGRTALEQKGLESMLAQTLTQAVEEMKTIQATRIQRSELEYAELADLLQNILFTSRSQHERLNEQIVENRRLIEQQSREEEWKILVDAANESRAQMAQLLEQNAQISSLQREEIAEKNAKIKQLENLVETLRFEKESRMPEDWKREMDILKQEGQEARRVLENLASASSMFAQSESSSAATVQQLAAQIEESLVLQKDEMKRLKEDLVAELDSAIARNLADFLGQFQETARGGEGGVIDPAQFAEIATSIMSDTVRSVETRVSNQLATLASALGALESRQRVVKASSNEEASFDLLRKELDMRSQAAEERMERNAEMRFMETQKNLLQKMEQSIMGQVAGMTVEVIDLRGQVTRVTEEIEERVVALAMREQQQVLERIQQTQTEIATRLSQGVETRQGMQVERIRQALDEVIRSEIALVRQTTTEEQQLMESHVNELIRKAEVSNDEQTRKIVHASNDLARGMELLISNLSQTQNTYEQRARRELTKLARYAQRMQTILQGRIGKPMIETRITDENVEDELPMILQNIESYIERLDAIPREYLEALSIGHIQGKMDKLNIQDVYQFVYQQVEKRATDAGTSIREVVAELRQGDNPVNKILIALQADDVTMLDVRTAANLAQRILAMLLWAEGDYLRKENELVAREDEYVRQKRALVSDQAYLALAKKELEMLQSAVQDTMGRLNLREKEMQANILEIQQLEAKKAALTSTIKTLEQEKEVEKEELTFLRGTIAQESIVMHRRLERVTEKEHEVTRKTEELAIWERDLQDSREALQELDTQLKQAYATDLQDLEEKERVLEEEYKTKEQEILHELYEKNQTIRDSESKYNVMILALKRIGYMDEDGSLVKKEDQETILTNKINSLTKENEELRASINVIRTEVAKQKLTAEDTHFLKKENQKLEEQKELLETEYRMLASEHELLLSENNLTKIRISQLSTENETELENLKLEFAALETQQQNTLQELEQLKTKLEECESKWRGTIEYKMSNIPALLLTKETIVKPIRDLLDLLPPSWASFWDGFANLFVQQAKENANGLKTYVSFMRYIGNEYSRNRDKENYVRFMEIIGNEYLRNGDKVLTYLHIGRNWEAVVDAVIKRSVTTFPITDSDGKWQDVPKLFDYTTAANGFRYKNSIFVKNEAPLLKALDEEGPAKLIFATFQKSPPSGAEPRKYIGSTK